MIESPSQVMVVSTLLVVLAPELVTVTLVVDVAVEHRTEVAIPGMR